MDAWLDIVWENIVDAVAAIAAMLDRILAPFNQTLGPAATIFLLVVVLVAATKFLTKIYTTKRHKELKDNYEHWYALRREAMACEDREKGKALARNIDQAQLNKAYYDYFFEGLLKSILTAILPILFTAAYVNRAYAPEQLREQIGRKHIFIFSGSGNEPVVVSSFFWFVICLIAVHVIWFTLSLMVKKAMGSQKANRMAS